MARAKTYTWLPLDVWARMLGYNLWLFNGFRQPPSTVGTQCHDIWYQYPEQYETISREELAIAIKQAETQLANFVGYNLLPDYNHEIVKPPRFHKPEYRSALTAMGTAKSVNLTRKYLIDLGVKSKVFLDNVEVVRIDKDGDGFPETGRITIPATIPPDQVRIYYPGQNGEDCWEIRPTELINNTTLEVPVYLIPQWERLEGISPIPIDHLDDTAYLNSVDIYQVYTDTTTQVELLWDGCNCSTPCLVDSREGCAYIMDHKLGYITYNPTFQSRCSCCNDPDHIKVYYKSGYTQNSPRPSQELDPFWQAPIAYFAISFFNELARDCCDGKQSTLVSQWGEDFAVNNKNRSYFTTQFMVNNPFGVSTKGAYFAYIRARTKRI